MLTSGMWHMCCEYIVIVAFIKISVKWLCLLKLIAWNLIMVFDVPFQIGEARALYSLGNVYHAKGKHFGKSFHHDPGDFPEEVKSSLERAAEFYE